jgi:hypothetical protein
MMIDGAMTLRGRVFESHHQPYPSLRVVWTISSVFISRSTVFRLCPSRSGDMIYHFGKLLPYLISLPFPNIACTPAVYSRSCGTYIHFT